MKLEADEHDAATVYALLKREETLTDAAIEKARKYARKRKAAFVEVWIEDKFSRLVLAQEA